jgi:DNA-binding transcriptional MerR regulator
MAYYPENTIERIRLIRELMEKRHLTLAQIRDLLQTRGEEYLKEILAETQKMERFLSGWLEGEGKIYSREELLEGTGIEEEVLEKLKKMGLLEEVARDRFDGISYDLALAVARMRRAGLTEELGFHPEDLSFYVSAIGRLVEAEIREFNRRVFGKISRRRLSAIVKEALENSEILWIAIRRRAVLKTLKNQTETLGTRIP